MPMRESARGHASSRRLPRSQTSRFSLFPPDPSPRLCQYCRPHPFFLHPEAIQDRLFSVFRFCGRRSFLANAKASLSCPDRTVCFARISRSINLLRRDQFSESCRLRPCFFTILSEARSRHCRFSIIFSPSLSAIFCDAQIALVITHFCRKGTLLQIDQQMSLRRAISHNFPDRRFHQIGWKLMFKAACYLADRGHFSPRPDLLQGGSNVSKGGKRLAPGMQEDQVVVATFGKSAFGPNPEDALLEAGKPSCCLCFGEVAIPTFVILHPRLGDERFSGCQHPHHIGQILVGFAIKRVANREWRMFRDRQPVRRGKLRANVATCVAFHLGMILKPEHEAFFELATERLSASGARFEARNPS